MPAPILRDAQWVRQAFLVPANDLFGVDNQNRTFTTASLKYTDTTPGGNICINPPPQFTRTADLKVPGRFVANIVPGSNRGMGRYYSEAIDDHSQIIHMRMGVPQYSPMTQFFSHFYNSGAGQLARTGRANSAFYWLGRAAGFVVTVMSWKILAVHMLGVATRALIGNTSSRFYYLKPAMPLYWSAVTTMVNQLAVNRGIIPRVGGSDMVDLDGNPPGNEINTEQLNSLLPDIFKKNGGIDVYAMANRAQRLARKQFAVMEQELKNNPPTTTEELSKRLQKINSQPISDTPPVFDDGGKPEDGSPISYMKRWLASALSVPAVGGAASENAITPETKDDGIFEFGRTELDDGGAFASFRVNSTGPISESFSSQVGESDISSKINGMVSSARSTSFSLAGGNVVGGAAGAVVGTITDAVKSVVGGAMDSLSISGLAVFAGASFVDIPKHWQSSQAQLPRSSYTINLTSPYGNPISQLLNLYIPLSMLLATALPLSTGRQSYSSPFLLELYDQGRCQVRLGIVDSMQITRGTGNLGFNSEGHAMGIDVTFSVMDLSSIMHMPISQGFSKMAAAAAYSTEKVVGEVAGNVVAAALGGTFDDDNVFTDYMATLAGLGLADQIYQWRKLKLNATRAGAQWDSYLSPSMMAAFAVDTLPGRLISALYRGTARDSSSRANQ